jgi:protein-disulfide isomerase
MSKKSAESRAERTAALLQEQERQERRRQLGIVVGIMAVLAVIVGIGAFVMLKGDKTSNSTVSASDYSLSIGDKNAPTKVVIYEDFLCPFCGQFEAASSERLAAAAADGKVYVEYRPFNFLGGISDYPLRATNAFRAVWETAGPEAAKTFHDQIYAAQPAESGPYPADDWLVEQAVTAGATEDDVRDAIENLEYQDWVDAATKDASGIRSTPSVYLNGKLLVAGSIDEMAAQVFDAIG